MAGALGATVSTVTAKADEAAPVLPAVSVSVAVKLWVAFDRVPVVKLQAPLPFTVAVPSLVVPSNTATVLLASAAPVSVSVLTLVIWSPTTPLSGENDVMAGALGATVSTVTAKADEATPVLPAASVAVAVRLWAPLLSAAVVKLNAPLPFATAAQSEHRGAGDAITDRAAVGGERADGRRSNSRRSSRQVGIS